MNNFLDFLGAMYVGICVLAWLYMIVFVVRKAWGDAGNRTLKVCNVCFREIKAWNEAVKKEIES